DGTQNTQRCINPESPKRPQPQGSFGQRGARFRFRTFPDTRSRHLHVPGGRRGVTAQPRCSAGCKLRRISATGRHAGCLLCPGEPVVRPHWRPAGDESVTRIGRPGPASRTTERWPYSIAGYRCLAADRPADRTDTLQDGSTGCLQADAGDGLRKCYLPPTRAPPEV
ncbi:MAG: hypothetical protein, partial [Olavius algarvensis Delta 4 endosymbiont]